MKLGFIIGYITLITSLLMSCRNRPLESSGLDSDVTNESSDTSSLKMALANAPIGVRYGHSAVIIGRKMLVWGGIEHHGRFLHFKSDGAMFDFDTKKWTVIPDSPLTPRFNHAAVAIGNKMIVTGGLNDGAASYRYPLAKGAAMFDIDKMEWTPISGIPESSQVNTLSQTSKFIAMSLNDGQNIFMCCTGYLTGTYNISTGEWSSRGGIPERRNPTAVYRDGKVFVLGGETEEYGGTSYNLDTAAFEFNSKVNDPVEFIPTNGPIPEMLYGISNHTAVTYNGKMIVFGGGHSGSPGRLLGIFDFDSKIWQWKRVEEVDRKEGHTAVVIDHRMIIWGGASDQERTPSGKNPLILNLDTMIWE